ncbi:ShlB/FhaC/HecB family hemolysin secretion/activation protein, partial [Burkholderia gladioli]
MSIVRRGSSAATALLFVATNVSAQEAPRPIIPGNDQQSRQQEEARERERAVSAPGVRSAATA